MKKNVGIEYQKWPNGKKASTQRLIDVLQDIKGWYESEIIATQPFSVKKIKFFASFESSHILIKMVVKNIGKSFSSRSQWKNR